MKTIARKSWIDENGDEHINDIFISGGQFALCDGKESYAMIIESAILTVRGELLFDRAKGIPYFDTIFSSYNQLLIWKRSVRDRILKLPFAVTINKFDTSFDAETNTLLYSLVVRTAEGDVTVSN